MLPSRLTRDEASAFALRRERLMSAEPGLVGPSGEIQLESDIVGEPPTREFDPDEDDPGDYWDEYEGQVDDWEAWREDYAEQTGT